MKPEERRYLFFSLQRMTGAILDLVALDRERDGKACLTCK